MKMNIVVSGSCWSIQVAARFEGRHGGVRHSQAGHNRSDQFVKYFLDEAPRSPIEAVQAHLEDDPTHKDFARMVLENQYRETLGFNEMPPDRQAQDLISILDTKQIDLIILDNFMDVTAALVSLDRIGLAGESIFLNACLYANAAAVNDLMPLTPYLSPEASAQNWHRIIAWFKAKQPGAKIVFLCWPDGTSRDNVARYERIRAFYPALMRNVDPDVLVIPPLDIDADYTEGPDNWAHFKNSVYEAVAGYILLAMKSNLLTAPQDLQLSLSMAAAAE